MKKDELAIYSHLLGDIKTRGRQVQHRAALSVNAEKIHLYWDISFMIRFTRKDAPPILQQAAAELEDFDSTREDGE